jgi:hypothetical protein
MRPWCNWVEYLKGGVVTFSIILIKGQSKSIKKIFIIQKSKWSRELALDFAMCHIALNHPIGHIAF